MRKLLLLPVIFLCLYAQAQEADADAIRRMCADIAARYPQATLQDIYKTCYQDFFGAEHLMRDTAAARAYLQYELQQCEGQDLTAMPLREPTGFQHRFVRINLLAVLSGEMTEDELLRLFIEAAGKNNAPHDEWEAEWQQIETIATDVHPAWRDEALQQELRRAAQMKAAVRHSENFRNTYYPHYRIIRL